MRADRTSCTVRALLGIHYKGCSGRVVQCMGVVLYNKTANDVM